MTTTNKAAVAYVRVSKYEQAKGLSLDAQEERIKLYCGFSGLSLVDIKRENRSVFEGRHPPEKRRIVEQIREGAAQFGHVVVVKLDRLFRDTQDALETLKLFKANHIHFHSCEDKIDTSSAMGRLVLTIAAAFAEMESARTSERVQAVFAGKRLRGEALGHCPYGFRLAIDGKTMVPDPKQQRQIARMLCLRDLCGWSYQQIADQLNRLGYNTGFKRRDSVDADTKPARWGESTVRRICQDAEKGERLQEDFKRSYNQELLETAGAGGDKIDQIIVEQMSADCCWACNMEKEVDVNG